jgi:cytochrome P450
MATVVREGRLPEVDVDLFDEQSLRNPFAHYRAIRDAGEVVLLPKHDVLAVGRFEGVRAALRNPQGLVSGEGVGFTDLYNAGRGQSVLQADGELHRRLRSTLTKPLTTPVLREARAGLKEVIKERIESLTGCGVFDAIPKLASCLPLEVVSHLVGLPGDGRERMLAWAAASFNAVAPTYSQQDADALAEVRQFVIELSKEGVSPGSWAAKLFEAEQNGQLQSGEARKAIAAYIFPSLDTTILSKGHMLHQLGQSPEQLSLLQNRPELIPAAVLETVRHSAVVRWFARYAVSDVLIGDATIPAGQRVMILYGSANRDERHYQNPDKFDVTRDSRDHLGWGTGPHLCAGMGLAKLEMEVMLEALVEARVVLKTGEPIPSTNGGLYGFTSLPCRIDRSL